MQQTSQCGQLSTGGQPCNARNLGHLLEWEEGDLHALPALGTALIDVLPGSIAAHKGDGLDVGVVADPVDSLVRAVHNVQDTPAQLCLQHLYSEASATSGGELAQEQ